MSIECQALWRLPRDIGIAQPSCLTAQQTQFHVWSCRISTFNRQRLVDVAVANRHTVALLDDGCVFSWGSNLQGQLGYGTSDSASNATPRIVEAMKVGIQIICIID